ncbi:MAG: hypothetical protein PF637_14725 [Spirochaetes bacterium]|jgi:hypothetical protein|nr:hypothetical protein [Spirochaetota bacterium]
MAVSPIDLQANMGHLQDVAKQTQVRTENLINQHQFLDHQSEEASNRHKDRLDSNKESDESRMQSAKERENSEKRDAQKREHAGENNDDDDADEKPHDPSLGNNIDFTR